MKIKSIFYVCTCLFFLTEALNASEKAFARTSFNSNWAFHLGESMNAEQIGFDHSTWEQVRLPHNANAEPLIVNDQWQGICWYRKTFDVSPEQMEKKVLIEFEGAMNYSQVWINGKRASEHHGGFLPVVIDASPFLKSGENVISVQLDNRDNPVTGPKPHKKTDFCMYGGLYRNVWISFKDSVHITHPNLVNHVAGGGVFITTPIVSKEESEVMVRTHVANSRKTQEYVSLVSSVYYRGKLIKEDQRDVFLESGVDVVIEQNFRLENPKLWSPDLPNLYQLKTKVLVKGKQVDEQTNRFGIREFVFKNNDLFINGKKTFLRGVNRHQEYPFVGYALSDNAHFRDAKQIKEAGFDLIRLSHYPQAPAFMDACDEFGIVVLDAILGWQYYSEDRDFRQYCFSSAEQLVRRDRNHPCVLAWEVSLNETKMPVPFMEKLHHIVHQEYPGENVYTCGWQNEVYDIFVQARQHRILHGYHDEYQKPFLVSEYGDWEYYSNNAGLNQDKLDRSTRKEKSSRQLRSYGELRLLQQAANVQEAHHDNLQTNAFADAYWVMYDYNSGCHSELCCSGLADIFRLEKFAYEFYRSQKNSLVEPVLEIASYWTEKSSLDVKVFSNCDEVELYLNGNLLGRKKISECDMYHGLSHPPFIFEVTSFSAGELKAIGYRNGQSIIEDVVRTPDSAVALRMWIDDQGIPAEAGCNDVVFLRIAGVDESGTIVPEWGGDVVLNLIGDVKLANNGCIQAEAGIATAVIRIGGQQKDIQIEAKSEGLNSCELNIQFDNH